MERSGKLADLKLVSKYYPVAQASPPSQAQVLNYSYPQPERLSQYGRRRSRLSDDRSSVGSEGSNPSLIEDRTDSEASLDDDYQYHAHGAELWDTFWLPSPTEKKVEFDLLPPRKQYPALIQPPRPPKKRESEERQNPAWPLPERESPRQRATTRKPTPTYSPFPKPFTLPPRSTSLVPSWQSSRLLGGKPKRPPRPDDPLPSPCYSQPSPMTATFPISPDAYQTSFSLPATPMEQRFPVDQQRPRTASMVRPISPIEEKVTASSVSRRSASRPPVSYANKPLPPIISKKSMPSLRAANPLPLPEPEPHSVFELDDSDAEDSHGLSFFRFHKRSGSSDTRRSAKSYDSLSRRRRARASTAPSSPTKKKQQLPSASEDAETSDRKRQGSDVIGRMLGLRGK